MAPCYCFQPRRPSCRPLPEPGPSPWTGLLPERPLRGRSKVSIPAANSLTVTSNRTSSVLRAEWIPACAGMTKESRHPGRRPGIHALAAAPEQASGVFRAEWIPACAGMTKKACHPGRRPGIHVRAEASEQASGVFRAGWIPAYAGMTKKAAEKTGKTGRCVTVAVNPPPNRQAANNL